MSKEVFYHVRLADIFRRAEIDGIPAENFGIKVNGNFDLVPTEIDLLTSTDLGEISLEEMLEVARDKYPERAKEDIFVSFRLSLGEVNLAILTTEEALSSAAERTLWWTFSEGYAKTLH